MQIKAKIGPAFGKEVEGSSLYGKAFAWGSDGVEWADGALTTQEEAELAALVTAHDPDAPEDLDARFGAEFDSDLKVQAILSVLTPQQRDAAKTEYRNLKKSR